jgi:hypothetical protein
MSGLWRGLGGHRSSGTRARSRRGRLGETLGGLRRLRLEQGSEFRHLLLQGGDLGLQGGNLLGQGEERSGKLRQLALNGSGWLCREGSDVAMMQASEQFQVLLTYSFFAAIAGMAL